MRLTNQLALLTIARGYAVHATRWF